MKHRTTRIAAQGILLITLGFGLRPFNFISINDVSFDPELPGLRFHSSSEDGRSDKRAIAFTEGGIYFDPSHPWSILLEVVPTKWPDGLGAILELHDGQKQPPLMVAQWKDHLALRSRRASGYRGQSYREIGVSDCLQSGQLVSLLISYDGASTRVLVNGALAVTRSGVPLLDASEPTTARIVLGNNATAERAWLGTLKRIALFNANLGPDLARRTETPPILDYRFTAPPRRYEANRAAVDLDLVIPERFRPVERKRFTPISELRDGNVLWSMDTAINFLGFIPAGIACASLLGAFFGNRFTLALAATLSTIALSGTIEVSQIYLPSRDPSAIDLALNSVAGFLAASGFALLRGARRNSRFA